MDVAFNYLNQCVMPILRDKNEFAKLIGKKTDGNLPKEDELSPDVNEGDDDVFRNHLSVRHMRPEDQFAFGLVTLAKCFIFFAKKTEAAFEEYKNLIIEEMDKDKLKILLSSFLVEWPCFEKCKPIIELLEQRKTWLENKLKDKPTFNWCMPEASFPNHPEIEAFLRSDRERMVYSDHFRDAKKARKFVKDHDSSLFRFRLSDAPVTYTVKMQAADKTIEITKTKNYFNDKNKIFTSYSEELKKINNSLQKS